MDAGEGPSGRRATGGRRPPGPSAAWALPSATWMRAGRGAAGPRGGAGPGAERGGDGVRGKAGAGLTVGCLRVSALFQGHPQRPGAR